MNCDTNWIEPDCVLVKYKQLAGGRMLKIVNQSVALGLETLGYTSKHLTSTRYVLTSVDYLISLAVCPAVRVFSMGKLRRILKRLFTHVH
ncbi:MAG: hypothetical protein AAGA30_16430, partial [Planctomycetota bacterium]